MEDRLRQLAVSDPLTGLANYRQLRYALDAEIKRSSRTDRPFALVLLDLDGLKRINDRHGTLEELLAAADRVLYESKARRRGKARVR